LIQLIIHFIYKLIKKALKVADQVQAELLHLILIWSVTVGWESFWQDEYNLTRFVINLIPSEENSTTE